MRLVGSCHCGAARFSVESHTPHLFNRYYCTACRKTAGAAGTPSTSWDETDTLSLEGYDHFDGYPEESIEDWHRKRGLWVD